MKYAPVTGKRSPPRQGAVCLERASVRGGECRVEVGSALKHAGQLLTEARIGFDQREEAGRGRRCRCGPEGDRGRPPARPPA